MARGPWPVARDTDHGVGGGRGAGCRHRISRSEADTPAVSLVSAGKRLGPSELSREGVRGGVRRVRWCFVGIAPAVVLGLVVRNCGEKFVKNVDEFSVGVAFI